jgi:hypothetical protein
MAALAVKRVIEMCATVVGVDNGTGTYSDNGRNQQQSNLRFH